jgi:hypothetical protein
MIALTFGKHKNEMLETTPESYLKWLATHKAVLSPEHRTVSDAAKEILERRAQATTPVETKGHTNWQEWHESLKKAEIDLKIAKHLISTPAKVDIGLKGNLNVSRAFSLMR